MHFFRSLAQIDSTFGGCVASIGNFDGLHLGHQALIERLKSVAKQHNLPSLLMMFEPQPLEFFQGNQAPVRLFGLRDKLLAMRSQQVDYVLCIRFNQGFSQLSANEFIQNMLVDRLKLKHLIIGDDFRFGHNREGDFQTLIQAGKRLGFEVEDTHTLNLDGARISSTRIRRALADNQLDESAALLGRQYSMSGRVVKGRQLARTLNSPTANVDIKRTRLPISGVFAVKALHQETQQVFQGVANLGIKPTVTNQPEPSLEVHLFDFSGNLYHQHLDVHFLKKLRDEKKFNQIDDLKQAIAQDQHAARQFFNSSL